MKSLWWLSFADPDLPRGRQFLGVVVVRADDMKDAMQKAWRLGINPGGEVKGYEDELIERGLVEWRKH